VQPWAHPLLRTHPQADRLGALGDGPADAMTMPMRLHIPLPAIAIPVGVPSDVMTMPPSAMGDAHGLLMRRTELSRRVGRPVVLGIYLRHKTRECQQDEACQRDDQRLHG
jgi:hypothetical protein